MDEQTLTWHLEELDLAALRISCAMEDRDEAITEALLAGIPASTVAKAVGLTRQRVWQIGRQHAPLRLG
jgi:hypothetical protein